MNWAAFYLVCFGVGFTLSFISFLSGAVHLHLPFGLHSHVGHGGGVGHGQTAGGGRTGSRGGWFNTAAVLAFLAWFGGVGYLLTTHYRIWYLTALGLSTLAGLVGATSVSLFLVKVLLRHEAVLDETEYRMDGMLATVSVPIRADGTGEILFTQGGVRRSAGARSDSGKPLEKGAEVVVARYEKGIAYVRKWEEFTK